MSELDNFVLFMCAILFIIAFFGASAYENVQDNE